MTKKIVSTRACEDEVNTSFDSEAYLPGNGYGIGSDSEGSEGVLFCVESRGSSQPSSPRRPAHLLQLPTVHERSDVDSVNGLPHSIDNLGLPSATV